MGSEISSLHGVIRANCSSNQTSSDWFERKEEIGSGHFGIVYACELKDNSREKFALKEISKPKDKEKKDLDNFIEISTAKQLRHPNIIQYYHVQFDVDSSKYLIFMRYAENGSLGQLIRKYGPLHDYLVGKYTKDILYGLAYLHKQNIIHRDIKCDNVLLDVNNTAKLSDFGLAKAMRESVKYFSTRCGTTHFRAPEIDFSKRHTLKADIWSIGATVLEMKLGTPPNQLDLRFTKDAKPLEFYEDRKKFNFSEDILSFLRLCLKTNYKLRPAVEELLEHQLCSLTKGEYVNKERSLVPYVSIKTDDAESQLMKVCFKWIVTRGKIIHKLKLEFRKLNEVLSGRTCNLLLLDLKERDCDVSKPEILSLSLAFDFYFHVLFGSSAHINMAISRCIHSVLLLMIKDQRETNELNEQLKKISVSSTLGKENWFEIKEKILQYYLKPSKEDIEVGDLFISELNELNQLLEIGYFELCIEECSITGIDRYSPEFNMYLLKRLFLTMTSKSQENLEDDDNSVIHVLEKEKQAVDNIIKFIRPNSDDLESSLASQTMQEMETWIATDNSSTSSENDWHLLELSPNFIKRMQEANLEIIETTKDGNCLFDAVSDQINRRNSAQELRQMTVETLQQNSEVYKDFQVNEDWNVYLRKLKEKAWGDHTCLVAISQILQRPIKVYSSFGKPYDTTISAEEEFEKAEPILLGNISNVHFVSLKKIVSIEH